MKLIKVSLVVLLLSSFFLSASASDISIENALGVHTFDLSSGDILESHGSFVIRNDANESVCAVIITVDYELDPVDLDSKGNARTHHHSLLNDNVTFHGLPDTSWIQLEETKVCVDTQSYKLIGYTINIPVKDLPEYVNTENGFLAYITVDSSGSEQINCLYKIKIFIQFEGTKTQSFMPSITTIPNFDIWIVAVASILIVISVIVVVKHKHHKKPEEISDIWD